MAGLTRTEYLRRAGAQMTVAEVSTLRPQELSEVDLATLGTHPLITALRRAASFHRWDLAERAMEALAVRTDTPGGDGEGYREELISAAVSAGNEEVAKRQIALLREGTTAHAGDLLTLELRRPTAETLAHLEQTALAGLRQPAGEDLLDLAFSLLKASPALGVVVARGSLSARRSFDSGYLVEVIEEARDRLGLPPGDAAANLFELLLDRDAASRVDDIARRGATAERDALAAQAEGLQDKLRDSKARFTELERRLHAQEASLDRLSHKTPPEPRTPVVAPEARPTPAAEEAERRRLRAKVDELKHLLTHSPPPSTSRANFMTGVYRGRRPIDAWRILSTLTASSAAIWRMPSGS